MDVDGRELDDEVATEEELVEPVVEPVIGGGHAERAEVRELTADECVGQNPELWRQFNEVCDKEEKVVEADAEQDDVPDLIDSDDESDDEGDDGDDGGVDSVERVDEPERRKTRSMTKDEAFVSLLAMISVAKLLGLLVKAELDEMKNMSITVSQRHLKQLLGDHLHAVARTDSRSVYDHVHFGRQVGEKRLLVELQAQ